MKKINHFIDGKIYSDKNARIGKIFNPAIGEQIAEVELASKAAVEMTAIAEELLAMKPDNSHEFS